MTLLASLLLLVAIGRWAPDSMLAQGLDRRIVRPLAQWLAVRSRTELSLYALGIVMAVLAAHVVGPRALVGFAVAGPELIAWASMIEFGTLLDACVTMIAVGATARLRGMAGAVRGLLRLGPARRSGRQRRVTRSRRRPPANDADAADRRRAA